MQLRRSGHVLGALIRRAQKNDAPMVYRHGSHPYLVTTHRENLKQHKISYKLFEGLVLRFLNGADWAQIA